MAYPAKGGGGGWPTQLEGGSVAYRARGGGRGGSVAYPAREGGGSVAYPARGGGGGGGECGLPS